MPELTAKSNIEFNNIKTDIQRFRCINFEHFDVFLISLSILKFAARWTEIRAFFCTLRTISFVRRKGAGKIILNCGKRNKEPVCTKHFRRGEKKIYLDA